MNRVLITGGTGLLGRAIVKGFLSNGFYVTFTTTSDEKGRALLEESTQEEAERLSYKVVKFTCETNVKEFVESESNREYTHLVNNARMIDSLRLNDDGYASEYAIASELFMAVTLPYLLSIGLRDNLINVINISSMYGVVPPNKHLYVDGYKQSPIQYGVAKAAQIHLTKELSVRFAEKGIRVNAVSYGGIEGRVDDAFKARYAELCPMKRMLNIDEIFAPIWFLASNDSSGMTGHNLVVDGGWSVW